MSDVDDFKNAVALMNAGKGQEAAQEFWRLYRSVRNAGLRLQVIDALMNAVDPVRENSTRIALANEGMHIAQQIQRDELRAYMMGRKASFLSMEVTFLKHRQVSLKLTPGWLGFATEAEKTEHEGISESIERIEGEIDALLRDALTIAQETADKKLEASIWMAHGDVSSRKYMFFKMNVMVGNPTRPQWKARWWNRLVILRRYGLENYLFYSWREIKELRCYISHFTECFLRAAHLYRDTNDAAEANALYNLANHLRTAFRFRQARKYLAQAKVIAEKNNDRFLLSRITAMEQSIRARNKDVPNYLEGETRDSAKPAT